MKKSLIALVLVAPLALSTTGCVFAVGTGSDKEYSNSDFERIQDNNREKLARVAVNDSLDSVMKLFGTPNFNEVYQKDGESI